MEIQDRVDRMVRVKASKIRPCPWNWRTHGDAQREALRGILEEVGIAGAVVARELEDGTFMLIDGHLRQDELSKMGDMKIPVLVLDVTEAEARKLLITMDPLASLAGVDGEKLGALLKGIKTKSKGLADLFSDLSKSTPLKGDDLELDIGGGEGAEAEEAYEPTPSHVRMVQLFLNGETLPEFEEYIANLAEQYGTDSATDTVMECLRRACQTKKDPAGNGTARRGSR
jgi:ParB-like chromosome segregation protein Spo0J